jgi:hypothetical protein
VRRLFLAFLFAVACFSKTAIADDPAASFVARMFMDVCIPNVGRPENVRAWALEKKLAEIPAGRVAFDVFVGPGSGGAAWAVPMSFGSFALSIRGTTQACAVYARAANPAEVESYFRKILEGVARPGLVVNIVKDSNDSGPTGTIHTLIYRVSAGGNERRGNLYTLQTAEKSGGAFQATLQAAKYVDGP